MIYFQRVFCGQVYYEIWYVLCYRRLNNKHLLQVAVFYKHTTRIDYTPDEAVYKILCTNCLNKICSANILFFFTHIFLIELIGP